MRCIKGQFPVKPAFVMIMGILLTGCLGGGNKVSYFVVNPGDLSVVGNGATENLKIELLNLHVPRYLERTHIAVRTSGNSLQFSELNQWGEDLRKNLMRTLARNLAQLLSTADISTPLSRSSSIPDYRLEVHIDQFEQDVDGFVRLAARWQLIDAGDDTPLGIRAAELTGTRKLDENDYDEMVSEMRDLFGQLCTSIAEEISDRASAG